jgi:hypothetical protein
MLTIRWTPSKSVQTQFWQTNSYSHQFFSLFPFSQLQSYPSSICLTDLPLSHLLSDILRYNNEFRYPGNFSAVPSFSFVASILHPFGYSSLIPWKCPGDIWGFALSISLQVLALWLGIWCQSFLPCIPNIHYQIKFLSYDIPINHSANYLVDFTLPTFIRCSSQTIQLDRGPSFDFPAISTLIQI